MCFCLFISSGSFRQLLFNVFLFVYFFRKLQTASIEWNYFLDSDDFPGDFQRFLAKLKLELKEQNESGKI